MADIIQAAKWLRGGYTVSRKAWVRMRVAEDRISGNIETRCYQRDVAMAFQIDDLLADDWMIDDDISVLVL